MCATLVTLLFAIASISGALRSSMLLMIMLRGFTLVRWNARPLFRMWLGHSSRKSRTPLLLISNPVNTSMSAFVQQLNKEMCVYKLRCVKTLQYWIFVLNVLQFNALIYNPIGRSRDIFMRFPINSPQVSVTDDLGQSVMAQVSHGYASHKS